MNRLPPFFAGTTLRSGPFACLLALWLVLPAVAQTPTTGAASVSVSSAESKQYLQSAQVELIDFGRLVFTDQFGVADFAGVPAGEQRLKVSYVGFEEQTTTVMVRAGQRASVSVVLTGAPVVQIAPFIVMSEREGSAAALARQKNAGNVKNVVAMDALGVLANDNPAELLSRIAGIYSLPSTEGNYDTPTIRGMPAGLNTITVDGAQLAPTQAMLRSTIFTNITASNFEEIQVTKALTPNLPADSISGQVDFKTKTALSLRTKRELSFRLGGKWSPGFFDYTPRREVPAVVPNLSISYREGFGLFGGEHNVGLAANAVYSENITQRSRTISRLDTTAEVPRFTERYERNDGIQDRLLRTANVRADFKLSPTARFNFSWLRNLQEQRIDRPDHYQMEYLANITSAGRSVATAVNAAGVPTAGGNIKSDSTESFTTVLASARTSFQITTAPFEANDQTSYFRFGGEHTLGAWKLDYSANYSAALRNVGGNHRRDGGLSFLASVPNIGWTLDKRDDPTLPVFKQTTGLSIYEVRNYSGGTLTQDIRRSNSSFASGELNLKRDITVGAHPWQLAGGGLVKRQKFSENNRPGTYTYLGPDGLAGVNPATGLNDGDLGRFAVALDLSDRLGLRGLPAFAPEKLAASFRSEPQAWRKDAYTEEFTNRASLHGVQEEIAAGYAMGSTRFGALGVVGGLRWERTETEARGYVKRADLPAITDAVARVNAEYGASPLVRRGSHDEYFPSLHLRYEIARDLLVRASYSTSIGRPAISTLLPNLSVSDATQRITIDNPSLKSQFAEGYDLTFEYYLKPIGQISAGLFRKDLRNFLFTQSLGFVEAGADNGYGGLYRGYEVFTTGNGGNGRVEGVEFSYLQQLTALPGFLRGFTVLANYTRLRTAGDYGPTSTNLTGFVPTTANVRLSYKFRRVGAYGQWTYVGRAVGTFNPAPYLMSDILERRLFNAGCSVTLSRRFEVFCDVTNLFDEPQRTAQHVTRSTQSTIYNGPFVSFGLSGRF